MISSKYGFLLNPGICKNVEDLLADFKFNKINIGDIPEEIFTALRSLRGLAQRITVVGSEDEEEGENSLDDFAKYVKNVALGEILYDNDMDKRKKMQTLSQWSDLYKVVESELSIELRENLKQSDALKKQLKNQKEEMDFVLSSIKTLVTPRMTLEDREMFFKRLSDLLDLQKEKETK